MNSEIGKLNNNYSPEYPPKDISDTTVVWCNFTEDYVCAIDDGSGGVETFTEETLLGMLDLLREVKKMEEVDE